MVHRALWVVPATLVLALATGCSSAPSASPAGASSGAPSRDASQSPPDGDTGANADADLATISIDRADVLRNPASSIPAGTLDEAVAANNAFAIELYGQVVGDGGANNVLTAPLSASLALTMAYAAASGGTATEMAAVLHANLPDGGSIFDGQNALGQALAGRAAAALADALQATPDGSPPPSASDYQLRIVNAVWGEQTFPWSSGFLTTLAASYGTGVYLSNFIHNAGLVETTINGWVTAQTDGQIVNLLPPGTLDTTTRFVLLNALYMNLPWVARFDASMTAPGTFTRADGSTVSPSFMNQTTALPYDDDGQAQIVELPMAGGEALVVALPHAGTDLAAYEANLATSAAPWPPPTSIANVALSIPKLALAGSTFSLSSALQALGMQLAFSPVLADFTGMCPLPPNGHLYIADVLQQTTWSMQENGLQAAAATAVIGDYYTYVATSSPPPITVTVDRPYLIAIEDTATGAILFIGHVMDPTAP
jgi:serpin B